MMEMTQYTKKVPDLRYQYTNASRLLYDCSTIQNLDSVFLVNKYPDIFFSFFAVLRIEPGALLTQSKYSTTERHALPFSFEKCLS